MWLYRVSFVLLFVFHVNPFKCESLFQDSLRPMRVLLVLLVAVTTVTATQQTVQLAETRGESGVKCTRAGVQCVTGTRCARRRCSCPRGQSGNGQFECIKRREKVCTVTGDARITGFGGATVSVAIPCSYTASRYVIAGQSPLSTCAIEIQVTNEAWRNTYRARAVHVSVGVTDPMRQLQRTAQATVTGNRTSVNSSALYTYEVRSTPTEVFTWGSSSSRDTGGDEDDLIIATKDDENNFLRLDLPECSTRIKFRAHDSSKSLQSMLPGVAVVVPDSAEFITGRGDYPSSLCGSSRNGRTLYTNRASSSGIGNRLNSLLADVLNQRPKQFENPLETQCERAVWLYASSKDKKSDINGCGFLLTRSATAGCLQNKGIAPIDAFNACMTSRQASGDASACNTLQRAMDECGHTWVGPRPECTA